MNFTEFPKMARLSRECIITEKIDGTNASILISPRVLEMGHTDGDLVVYKDAHEIVAMNEQFVMRAGSRTKWITPKDDNFGFAKWVVANAEELFKLGEGHHFGEWWGQGIQRGYGLKEKRFSLFNVKRWDSDDRPTCCHVVPTLAIDIFCTELAQVYLDSLAHNGSLAAPGFMSPEGIVIFHTAGNVGFKKTIEKDELPKSLVK